MTLSWVSWCPSCVLSWAGRHLSVTPRPRLVTRPFGLSTKRQRLSLMTQETGELQSVRKELQQLRQEVMSELPQLRQSLAHNQALLEAKLDRLDQSFRYSYQRIEKLEYILDGNGTIGLVGKVQILWESKGRRGRWWSSFVQALLVAAVAATATWYFAA